MNRTLLLPILLCLAPLRAGAYDPGKAPGPVAVERHVFHDPARDRDIPVTIYLPARSREAAPLILFSHGLGATRDTYRYLGRFWASHGYASVHPQHAGSDEPIFAGREDRLAVARRAAADPANITDRPLDVRFVIDALRQLVRREPRLAGRIDFRHIGVAGHSFGAATSQAIIGARQPSATVPAGRLVDPRIRAAVLMSPSVPRGTENLDQAFRPVTVPCLHMTGTLDDSLGITDAGPADRRIPFDRIQAPHQYLVIFIGADHLAFWDGGRYRGDGTRDPLHHRLISLVTTAFWDAYLRDRPAARRWLDRRGARRALGELATLERK